MAQTPQRFSGRAGSRLPGRVRRSLDAHVDTDRRINSSLDVDKDGRLGAKLARNSGLTMTRDGLKLDPQQLGDKNRPPIDRLQELSTSASTSDLISAYNELLRQLSKSGRMR